MNNLTLHTLLLHMPLAPLFLCLPACLLFRNLVEILGTLWFSIQESTQGSTGMLASHKCLQVQIFVGSSWHLHWLSRIFSHPCWESQKSGKTVIWRNNPQIWLAQVTTEWLPNGTSFTSIHPGLFSLCFKNDQLHTIYSSGKLEEFTHTLKN